MFIQLLIVLPASRSQPLESLRPDIVTNRLRESASKIWQHRYGACVTVSSIDDATGPH